MSSAVASRRRGTAPSSSSSGRSCTTFSTETARPSSRVASDTTSTSPGKARMPPARRRVRFGVFLPSYVVPGEPAPTVGFLQDFARRAEDVGFDSVWVFDHLFDAPPSYRVVFMEPLT